MLKSSVIFMYCLYAKYIWKFLITTSHTECTAFVLAGHWIEVFCPWRLFCLLKMLMVSNGCITRTLLLLCMYILYLCMYKINIYILSLLLLMVVTESFHYVWYTYTEFMQSLIPSLLFFVCVCEYSLNESNPLYTVFIC